MNGVRNTRRDDNQTNIKTGITNIYGGDPTDKKAIIDMKKEITQMKRHQGQLAEENAILLARVNDNITR
jgi:hypothetical protein